MLKRLFQISLLTTFYSIHVGAVSLEEAMENSYSHYPEFKIVQEKFLTDIEAMPQALSGFMPKVYADVQLGRNRTKQKATTTNILGTSDSKFISPTSPSKTHKITIQQNVFNGGASMAALAAAQKGFNASRAEYFNNEQKALTEVLNTYVGYISAKEKDEISLNTLNAYKTRLASIEAHLQLGLSTRADVASARAQLASAEYSKLKHEADLRSAYENFIRITGLKPQNLVMPQLPNLPSSIDELIQRVMHSSPTVEILKNRSKQANYKARGAKGALLPSASVSASVSRSNSTQHSATQYSKNRTKNVETALSVRIPILSEGGAEYSRIRTAKKQARSSALQLEKDTEALKTEAISAWAQYQAGQQMLVASKQQVESEELALEGIQFEADLGVKNTLDILNAEEALYKARIAHVDAKQKLILSAYQIQELLGDMTARRLELKAKLFNPEFEFKKLKTQIIGF